MTETFITVYEVHCAGLTEKDYEGIALVGPVPESQSMFYCSTREQAEEMAERRRQAERRPHVSYRVVEVSDRVSVCDEEVAR